MGKIKYLQVLTHDYQSLKFANESFILGRDETDFSIIWRKVIVSYICMFKVTNINIV